MIREIAHPSSTQKSLSETLRVNKDKMRAAAAGGFINATDCADYLVKHGMPFRDAYKITGRSDDTVAIDQ